MIKKLWQLRKFFLNYRLFSLALMASLAALVLLLTGHGKIANWVLAIVAALELLPLLWDMWQDLRAGKYGIDILAATAIATSLALGEFWAGMVVVLMLTGGEALEDFAEHRAKSELDSLLEHAPRKAHVLRKGKLVDVNVNDIKVGDKVVIKPGEVVPVDAILIEGTASFDESSLTGESLPQAKQVKDQLLSGSISIDGAVTAKALATAEDSQYQQIIKLVQSASASQSPFVRLADRYSLPFTFLAYALGVAVWVISGQAVRFLEVIIVATPCPLLLAAPIALISGMSRASKHGIIVKTGSAMERLAEARTVAFDKTGTLTRGQPVVEKITALAGFDKDEVLIKAASLEQNSNHVVAQAIVKAAQEHGLKLQKLKGVSEISGLGLKADFRGQHLLAGRLNLLIQNGIKLPARFNRQAIKQTAIYVAVDDRLAGVITLKDEVRPEAKNTLQRLHDMGIKHTLMVTGDNRATANAIAQSLGIDHVHADMLPADKLHILDEIKQKPMAFVGDGVNDAPILTAADVGIALGARGSTAASESADMVIMTDNVGHVADAVSIAKQTFQIARQSILTGIALSVALMLAFATGKFPPLAGAIAQEAVDVAVIFNALRAHLITIND